MSIYHVDDFFIPGLYGLIAAKTYLQVTDPHYPNNNPQCENTDEVPESFQRPRHARSTHDDTDLLLLESGSSLGGTWAEERLYPNLLSQNSEGLYEFSDMSLSEAMEGVEDEGQAYQDTQIEDRFIPGWKLSRYLTVWSRKWQLPQYMRFNWQVGHPWKSENIYTNHDLTGERQIGEEN